MAVFTTIILLLFGMLIMRILQEWYGTKPKAHDNKLAMFLFGKEFCFKNYAPVQQDKLIAAKKYLRKNYIVLRSS